MSYTHDPERNAGEKLADGWTLVSAPTPGTPAPPAPARRRSRRRRITGLVVTIALCAVMFGASALLSGTNKASALVGHPDVLREGCTWDRSGNYVQNCKVWSASQQKFVIVQIRASNTSRQGIYLLDGMRARDDRSAWTTDVQAARVYDGSTDTTLVMPAGGASSFFTDWEGGAGPNNTTIKQETFLTSELPDYLEKNFGVSKSGNAIVGLSMSAGPAVTLAERHPEQFKVVQAMSGYYQTNNPIGALGIFAAQSLVSNYTNGIINMWGRPGSARWAANDPSQNVNKLKENGQVLIISSGNGFLTPSELAKLAPQDQISAIALEILSAVSTVLMQLQAAQTGASVISLPNYGGHTWENWGRALADGKPHVLDALRNTPPVTQRTQVVTAAGTRAADGAENAKRAVAAVSKTPPVLPVEALTAAESETSATDSAESGSSTADPSTAAGSSASQPAPGTSTATGTPSTDPATAPTTDAGATGVPAPSATTPSTTTPSPSAPTTTTPGR
ncbi:hypothetical protein GCM10009624_20640 [Gordonia sinesedis]